ncbi:hypothetical protein Y032_0006g2988 [Ancylostoma ceylanicum]|uniref:Secreted protein n=1 Tax=Ancylostoma ceylanicum TaxID=53326 RepID=A0A016VQ70_9BILA|nr:hypothetical protein Y032_0006g2988 [Ancylostoma ceylanicum]
MACRPWRVRLLCLGLSVVQSSRYRSSLANDCEQRQATGPPWPSSGENAIPRVLLDQAENPRMPVCLGEAAGKTCGCGSADGDVRKAPEHESTEGGWVHSDPTVRMTSGYWSADPEVRKRRYTGTRWRDVSAVAQ